MSILKIDMLPAGYTGKVRTHTYDNVDRWDYFFDGELIEIVQGNKLTHIPVVRIDRIIQVDTKVLNMVK